MKRTKRLAIEVWHREVVITFPGTPGENDAPRTVETVETVCDVCGSPWITVALHGIEGAPSGTENIYRALQQAGAHLQVSSAGQLNICRKSLEDLKEKH